MNLEKNEAELRHSMAAEATERAAAVEALIAELLSGALGLSARSTDGFLPIREEVGPTRYFAVGKIVMIDDQSTQLVSLDLAFADADGIKAGSVRLGACSAAGRDVSESRLERLLHAYPHEMADTLVWTHVFERHSDGWLLANPSTERDDRLQDVEVRHERASGQPGGSE